MANTAIIRIEVGLDEQRIPERICWESSDNPQGNQTSDCKAIMLAFFEKEHLDTMRLDLWTKDMEILEMDRFFFQTLQGMADTYFRATQNKELASQMREFSLYFGEKTGIIPPLSAK
jgi:gliding motility-associated protein GldC